MYHLEPDGIVAVGISGGADIGAALLLRYPSLLRGAVLFDPRLPFEPEPLPRLAGTSVFIAAVRSPDAADSSRAERLTSVLRDSGCHVVHHAEEGRQTPTTTTLDAASEWMGQYILTADRYSLASSRDGPSAAPSQPDPPGSGAVA